MFKFELTNEQIAKFLGWKKTLPKTYTGAIGGGMTFSFSPNGLGTVVVAKYLDKYEIDLTDYNW